MLDEAFDNYKAAKGTDSIKKMSANWKKIQKNIIDKTVKEELK